MTENLSVNLVVFYDIDRSRIQTIKHPIMELVIHMCQTDNRLGMAHSAERFCDADTFFKCREATVQVTRSDIGLEQGGKFPRNLENHKSTPDLNDIFNYLDATVQHARFLKNSGS
jgi:hypothetical protein